MSGVHIDRCKLWRQSIGEAAEAATESREGRRACGQRPEDGTRPRDLQVHRGDWVPARARCADRHALLCGLHRSLSHDSWCSVVTARTSDTWSAAADTLPTLLLTLSQTLVIMTVTACSCIHCCIDHLRCDHSFCFQLGLFVCLSKKFHTKRCVRINQQFLECFGARNCQLNIVFFGPGCLQIHVKNCSEMELKYIINVISIAHMPSSVCCHQWGFSSQRATYMKCYVCVIFLFCIWLV